jgi:hypothetical protein
MGNPDKQPTNPGNKFAKILAVATIGLILLSLVLLIVMGISAGVI